MRIWPAVLSTHSGSVSLSELPRRLNASAIAFFVSSSMELTACRIARTFFASKRSATLRPSDTLSTEYTPSMKRLRSSGDRSASQFLIVSSARRLSRVRSGSVMKRPPITCQLYGLCCRTPTPSLLTTMNGSACHIRMPIMDVCGTNVWMRMSILRNCGVSSSASLKPGPSKL